MSGRFELALALGRLGEELVVDWLQGRAWGVNPCYAYSNAGGMQKAPRLQFSEHGFVLPDLDACRSGVRCWVEVKTYTHAPWNERHKAAVHGIERRLLDQYMEVQRESGTAVYLLVLEIDSAVLLAARMVTVEQEGWPCQCRGCAATRPCRAKWANALRAGVYLARGRFRTLHTFAAVDMAEIREARDSCRSACHPP